MERLANLPVDKRLELLSLTSCRPLQDAKEAISLALARFHESWQRYRSITPTLYLIGDEAPGAYVTLGRLRQRHGLSWDTITAVTEALERVRDLRGWLVAASGVGGEPPRPLFALQGHELGERQHGALDLTLLAPFEGTFTTELELEPDAWRMAWSEAVSNANLLK